MRRDIALGTAVGITIGIIAYISSRPKPPVVAPIVEIDPAIYRMPNPHFKHPTKPVLDSIFTTPIKKPTYKAPYDVFGFGFDTARNTDSIDPDTYLNMPLESDGITYKTRDKYTSLEEEDEVTVKKYKYVRFTVLDIRGDSDTVAIGGIRFLREGVPLTDISLWNPHTGERVAYNNEEWNDSDQWSVVFVFPEPVAITEYQLKSSMKMPEMDPVKWKMEGSLNASFWNEIHIKSWYTLVDRGAVMIVSV